MTLLLAAPLISAESPLKHVAITIDDLPLVGGDGGTPAISSRRSSAKNIANSSREGSARRRG